MDPILLTDSYKPSHWLQYPPNTESVYSYLESRGGADPETVFHGLQYLLMRYLHVPITEEDVKEAERCLSGHLGSDQIFNRAGWNLLLERHQGRLPLKIRAVPEGLVVPVKNVLMTVENTDPDFFWLTNYVETLLVQAWYPIAVATNSREIKRIIRANLELTGDPAGIDFKLHDFGFRGSTSVESAAIGGCAHLTSFKGTDTLPALAHAEKYYGEPMAGFSIPAAEHSTITSWGRAHEVDAYRNMLDKFPTGLVAVVSDSYNIFAACQKLWGDELRTRVLERDGVLVVRPDSGDPAPTVLQVIETLGGRFGYETNAKGYRVLHPKVRVIQGDGIDRGAVQEILETLEKSRWSGDNVAFGSGGGLLQKFDRDTHKMAFKCSAIKRAGVWLDDISKDPITDPGKKSKAGRLALVNLGGRFETVPLEAVPGTMDQLETVFLNGDVTKTYDLESIRERCAL